MDFIPHGEFTLSRCDRLVIATLNGGWNKEAAEHFEKEFMRVADPLIGQKWAHLVYLQDWDLGVPEIGKVIKRLVSWCIANGLVRTAQVYGKSMAKQYLVDKLVTEETGDFKRKVFQDEKLALAWLCEQGFAADKKTTDEAEA